MNQHDQNDDYNIVIDTLQKKLDALEEMQRGCNNLNRSIGGGIGMMDSIRYEQIDELSKAIKREKDIAHVNETPKIEHDGADVLTKAGDVDHIGDANKMVRLTEEEIADEYSKADAYLMMCDEYEFGLVANAIMDAMEKINQGETK